MPCCWVWPRWPAAPLAQVDKPVRLLVGFAPGGSADIAGRLLAERMKDELKQNVVVDNKPGAGGRIAAELLKNAPADGSTIMIAPIVVPVLAPLVFSKLNYDPQADFAPVAAVANFQFGLSVNAAHPAKTVRRAGGLVEGQPGAGQLRHPGAGQPAALLRRDDRARRRARPDPRALQRRRPADDRADGQPGQFGHRHAGRPDRAAARRQDPHPGQRRRASAPRCCPRCRPSPNRG